MKEVEKVWGQARAMEVWKEGVLRGMMRGWKEGKLRGLHYGSEQPIAEISNHSLFHKLRSEQPSK